jgi:hypothetical protein
MVPWGKRLGYSFISVLFGGGVVGIGAAVSESPLSSNTHPDPARLLTSTLIVLAASIPGWLVAAPFVILVRDYSGWRVWLWASVGISIGPALILGFVIFGEVTNPRAMDFSAYSGFLLLATCVSTLSTGAYLFLALYRSSTPSLS